MTRPPPPPPGATPRRPPAGPPAPRSPLGAPAAAAPKEHKMAQGETFSSIALSLYGDARYAREIVKANPTLEPSRVRAGTVIKLPDMATIRASQTSPAAAGGSAVTAGATSKA